MAAILVTQEMVEVLADAPTVVRNTMLLVEVLSSTAEVPTNARISSLHVEVLAPVVRANRRRPLISFN